MHLGPQPASAVLVGKLLRGMVQKLRGIGLRGFVKNAATLSFGSIVAQLMLVAATPILTRQYGTGAYGVFSVFASVVAILAPIVCLRLDFAVPLPFGRRAALGLLQGSCMAGFGLSLAISLIVAFLPARVRDVWFGDAGPLLQLLWFALSAAMLQLVLTGWNVREKEFRLLSAGQGVAALVTSVTQVLVALFSSSAVGLIVGMAAGQWAGCVAQCGSAVRATRRLGIMPIRVINSTIRNYRPFLVWTLPSSVVNALGVQLMPIVVVALYGAHSGGQFFLAYRVVNLPTMLIGTSLGRVMWGEVARLRRRAPERLRPMFLAVLFGILLITAPGLLLLPFGRIIFSFVFGCEWAEAGPLAAILFFSAWIGVASTTCGNLTTLGYNHWQAGWEVVRLSITLLIAAAAMIWRPSLVVFVLIVSTGWAAGYIILSLLNWIAICRTSQG